MKSSSTRLPDLTRRSFARTNAQTIAQRVVPLHEFALNAKAISEVCCGDYWRQHQAYTTELGVDVVRGLDLEPAIVTANREKGIGCYLGNALDVNVVRLPRPYKLLYAVMYSCVLDSSLQDISL